MRRSLSAPLVASSCLETTWIARPVWTAGPDGARLDILQYSPCGTNTSVWAARTIRSVTDGPLAYRTGSDAYLLARLGIARVLDPEPHPASRIAVGLGAARWRSQSSAQ
jgi:hypothetical protein